MTLSKTEIEEVMKFTHDTITYDKIEKIFCRHFNKKTQKMESPKYSFQDEFYLEPGSYYGAVKERTRTNCGQWIVNNALYGNCPTIIKVLGYVNKPFDKKTINGNEKKLVIMIAEKKLSTDEYIKYLNNIQWFGNVFNAAVAPSFTPGTTCMLPDVKKEKDKLYKEYSDEINKGDVIKSVQISDKLMKMAKEEVKNDVGMDVYNSGAKPKFGNVYRSMYVSRGPIYNASEGKFDNSKNSLSEGMDVKDLKTYGNSVVNGAYPKAIGTAKAGYETKKLFACYQAIKAGPKGSDCGSKMYREVSVTSNNIGNIIGRYYLNGNKLEVIKEENANKLIGKTIKMRSPLYCAAPSGTICNKCLGEMPYSLGITNIGLTSSAVGTSLLNLLMKSFHDTTQHITKIDINKMSL